MDEENRPWLRREEQEFPHDKLTRKSPFRRYMWQIIVAVLGVLVLIFAIITGLLLLSRPVARQAVTSTPISTSQAASSQQSTATAQAGVAPIPTTAATSTSIAQTPIPQSQGLPCTVNLSTWTDGSSDWKILNGTLLNDGTKNNWDGTGGPTIVAPCDAGSTVNYAVETKVQVTSSQYDACFGITVRGNPNANGWQGYKAGVGDCGGNLDKSRVSGPDYYNDSQRKDASFNPGPSVHTYRVEVKDNTIKYFIDGGLVLNLIDNRFLTGSEVGLWDQNVQLTVVSFKVTAL
jgi:hypothetical protein